MGHLIRGAVAIIWRALLPVPMPWRAALLVSTSAICGYQLVRCAVFLSLLPEFWVTAQLRRWHLQPLPGAYAYGELASWVIRVSRWLAVLGLAAACVCLLAWYARPSVTDATLERYIDQGIAWWYALEEGIVGG